MGNFFYPRTIEVGGNLSGSGLAENPTGLRPNINIVSANVSSYVSSSDLHVSNDLQVEGNTEVNTLSASNGLSSSFFYGDGTNIINVNPENIDFSDLLSDISSSFGQSQNISASFGLSANISASFGLKENISSSFAELSKTAGQTFAGPITASSLGVGTPVNSPYVDNQQIAQFRRPNTVGSMISVRSGDAQINIGAGADNISYNWINSKNSSNGGRDLRLEMGDGQSKVIIKSDGKVGIGTTEPSTPLSIGPTPQTQINSNELLQISNTTANDAYMTARSNEAVAFFGAYQDNAFVGSQTEDRFVLTSNNRTRMCITSDGKVGVGTDFITPDELLHVSGNLKVNNDAKIANYNGTTLLYVKDSTGVVGINTDSPDGSNYFLDVNGKSIFRDNIKITNGNGISFSDTIPDGTSPTSELLDDYEEGTWTAIIGGSSPNAGEYNATDEKYIKIGSVVSIWCTIFASQDYEINQNFWITGLPFSCPNTCAAIAACKKNNSLEAADSVISCTVNGVGIDFETDAFGGHRYFYVFASYRV